MNLVRRNIFKREAEMELFKIVVLFMSALLNCSCAPIDQTNSSDSLPYYCDANITSVDAWNLFNDLRFSVNNPIVENCPSDTVYYNSNNSIVNLHIFISWSFSVIS